VYNTVNEKYFDERKKTLSKISQKTCMDAALSFLSARMRSTREMRSHLVSRGYEQLQIEQTLSRLHELGYIDDAQFAGEFVRAKTTARPIGKRVLEQALKSKGIDRETVDASLEAYTPQEEQRACNQLFEKLANKHGTGQDGFAKIQRALLYRGFSYDAIRIAARAVAGKDELE
jgi:regulatory protein